MGSWRAPDANWNCFVTESFTDELAHAAAEDALVFRLSMLKGNPRGAAVLRLAAEKPGWGRKRTNVAQDIAVVAWFGSYGALAADVSMPGAMPRGVVFHDR